MHGATESIRLDLSAYLQSLPEHDQSAESGNAPEPTVAAIRQYLVTSDQQLNLRFRQQKQLPMADLLRARAHHFAQAVQALWQATLTTERLSDISLNWFAIGGFGRGELHPFSDIDLLLIYGDELDQTAVVRVEQFIGICWDAGITVSHSVQTLQQCIEHASQDVSFFTSLMEARQLTGDPAMLQTLKIALETEQLWPVTEYFYAKSIEQDKRHERFDDAARQLEPDIKHGPGGLRDLQTIGWVARRFFGDSDLATLSHQGLLNAHEYEQLIQSRDFMWRVRWANHLLAGRAEERLLFARQKQLAEWFGYQDKAQPNRAVEQFMQQYYRHNTRLQRYNEHLLQQFREELNVDSQLPVVIINERFQVRQDYLEARHPDTFTASPDSLLELFLILQQRSDIAGVRATTIRQFRQALVHMDEQRPEFYLATSTLRQFCQLLQQQVGVYGQLARMHRYGLLRRLLPGFANISGLMQFDLFHVYTVDQHILFVLRNLRRMAYGKYQHWFGHAIEILPKIEFPAVLYLAALFHDIAKGQGGDHSELGAEMAKQFCRQADIPASQAELISWLVEAHLLMSYTAQRKDLSDPDVIQSFADKVQTQDRLNHLYLLTVADIAGTNPELWNSWKDSLLWDLYQKASDCFHRGLGNRLSRAMLVRETRARVFSELLGLGFSEAAISHCWQRFNEQWFLRLEDDQLMWITQVLLARESSQSIDIVIRELIEPRISELLVIGPSFDGFFATITGVMEQRQCSIYSAKIHSSHDPDTSEILAIDLLQFANHDDQPIQRRDAERLRDQLRNDLQQQNIPAQTIRHPPRRLREFGNPLRLRFTSKDLQLEAEETISLTELELHCTDRPGLLSSVALVFFQQRLRLHDARVATFGERVEDTFLLSDYNDQPLEEQHTVQLCEALEQVLNPGV